LQHIVFTYGYKLLVRLLGISVSGHILIVSMTYISVNLMFTLLFHNFLDPLSWFILIM